MKYIDTNDPFYCGLITLVGRPNVGKSSLMNRLISHKVSIVSAKAQTTRNRINGILTCEDAQYIFIDTPGLHHGYHQYRSNKQIHHAMNKAAISALSDADVIVQMIEATQWTKADDYVNTLLKRERKSTPLILVINKIDKVKQKLALLPIIEKFDRQGYWQDIIPLCALSGDNVSPLLDAIKGYLPKQPAIYAEDMITDRSMRFMAAEMIREQLTKQLNQELPYGVSISIERFREEENIYIEATVFVERKGQKAIVIGNGGQTIKRIGSAARHSIEQNFEKKTHLNLWVKVRRHQETLDTENSHHGQSRI